MVNPPQSRRVEPSWRHKKIKVRKYVDDNIQAEKLKMKAGITFENRDGQFKNVRAMQSEQLFNHISKAATEQGLQVNSKKTTLLAMSSARAYRAQAHIYDAEKNRIDSTHELKALGFIFNDTATVANQVEALISKTN